MGKLAIDNKALSSADTVNDVRQLTDAAKVHVLIRGDLLNHAMFELCGQPRAQHSGWRGNSLAQVRQKSAEAIVAERSV